MSQYTSIAEAAAGTDQMTCEEASCTAANHSDAELEPSNPIPGAMNVPGKQRISRASGSEPPPARSTEGSGPCVQLPGEMNLSWSRTTEEGMPFPQQASLGQVQLPYRVETPPEQG
mmetsp:Transcript_2221/g.5249  ORF Transcript_2221/g.5249 Transcript_2221/m.5249 type:complete len:116 (-) Transcript_2221:155-502(-)